MSNYVSKYTGAQIDAKLDYLNQAILTTSSPTFFGAKLSGETISRALYLDASGNIKSSTTTSTQLGYLSDVTGALQAQINSKLASTSYTANDILAKLLTVDGSGSTLDADLLDGQNGSYYQPTNSYLQNINQNLGSGDSPTFNGLSTNGILRISPTTDAQKIKYYHAGNVEWGVDLVTDGLIHYIEGTNAAYKFSWGTMSVDGNRTYTPLMCLNASGNIGISTADIEVWNNSYRAIEFGSSSIMGGVSQSYIGISSNSYYGNISSFDRYKTTNPAAIYESYNGTHVFKVAPSGTADTDITWTNALTIDNSGNSTLNGNCTISGYADSLDGAGVLKINNSSDTGYSRSIQVISPNLTGGNRTMIQFGQSDSQGNIGYLGFSYTGNDSGSNYIDIGMYNYNGLVKIYKSGDVSITGSLTLSSRFACNGATPQPKQNATTLAEVITALQNIGILN
jgi:hypothetical protein